MSNEPMFWTSDWIKIEDVVDYFTFYANTCITYMTSNGEYDAIEFPFDANVDNLLNAITNITQFYFVCERCDGWISSYVKADKLMLVHALTPEGIVKGYISEKSQIKGMLCYRPVEQTPAAVAPTQTTIDYKYNEKELLNQLQSYIDKTYTEHYGNQVQAQDLIDSSGFGLGFYAGDIIKYASRYGKKDGYNRKDLMKILHYGVLLLNWHDNHVDSNNKLINN